MKHMRKIALMLAVLILTMVFPAQGVSAAVIGEKLGNVLNSDIKAFINDKRIPSYNIANKTVVVAEDLSNYGFDVAWNSSNRSVSITLNSSKKITPLKAEDNTLKPGSVAFPYVYTDIVAYVNGKKVESYNVQGRTVILFGALEQYGTFKWDSTNKHSLFYTSSSSSSGSSSSGSNKVGDVLGSVLNSNVKAFINGERIPSYNISNKTVVLAEDLANYGFDVSWKESSRSVYITLNTTKKVSPLQAENNTQKPGTHAFSYVYTDIVTYVNNKKVDSFNLQGKTAIYFGALEEYGTFAWDAVNSHSMLSTSFSISGLVRDASTSSAMSGVKALLKDKSGKTLLTETTATDGTYSFTGVAAGTYTIDFSITDYSTYTSKVNITTADVTKHNISMNKDKRTISGKIFAGSVNYALSGATVNLTKIGGGIVDTTVSDSDGSYEFTGVAIGSYAVEASRSGYRSETTSVFSMSNIDVGNKNLTLSAVGATVSGTIYIADNYSNTTRASGATVYLKNSGGGVVDTTYTGSNGEYSFIDVASGVYTVEVQMSGYTTEYTSSFSVSSADLSGKNITIRLSGYSISGSILDSDYSYNNGVSGATVNLRNSSGTIIATATSQSNGEYTISGLSQTSYVSHTIEVIKSGYTTVTQSFPTSISSSYTNYNISIRKTDGSSITATFVRYSSNYSITVIINGYEYTFYNYSPSAMSNAYGLSNGNSVTLSYTGTLGSSGAYLSSMQLTSGSYSGSIYGYVTNVTSDSITISYNSYSYTFNVPYLYSEYNSLYNSWYNRYVTIYYHYTGTFSYSTSQYATVTSILY